MIHSMEDKDFLFNAIQRMRFKNNWTKEELCHHLDVNMADLHKYLNGQEKPTESLLLIIRTELESGGYERRVKLRVGELVDRLIEMDRRMDRLEEKLDRIAQSLAEKKS